jgi:hypothetical protein
MSRTNRIQAVAILATMSGLGHMVQRCWLEAVAYLLFVPLLWLLWFPAGLILHGLSICHAALAAAVADE